MDKSMLLISANKKTYELVTGEQIGANNQRRLPPPAGECGRDLGDRRGQRGSRLLAHSLPARYSRHRVTRTRSSSVGMARPVPMAPMVNITRNVYCTAVTSVSVACAGSVAV